MLEPYEVPKPDAAVPLNEPTSTGTDATNSLPSGWKAVRLGEIAAIRLGRTPSRAEKKYWSEPKVPWVSISDLNNGIITATRESISELAHHETFRGEIVEPGTLLLSFKLTIGKTGILGIPAVHNEAIASLQLSSELVDRDFLAYSLQGFDYDDYLDAYVKGRTLNRDKLEQLVITLPPLSEQRAIAHVLRTVQRAKEATEQVIAEARELKKSLMRHLFTYGPVPVEEADKVRLKETEIGPVPEHWSVGKLGDLADVVSGGTPRRTEPRYWGGHIPWVKTGEINYRTITKTGEHITQEGLEDSSARIIPAGTVLMAMYGQGVTRGRVAVLGIDAAINQACAAFVTSRLNNWFLFSYMTHSYEAIRELGHGAHQKNLSAQLLKSVYVPVPPFEEQEKIAIELKPLDQKLAAEESRLASLDALFQSLLHHLMTGKVRVNHIAQSLGVE